MGADRNVKLVVESYFREKQFQPEEIPAKAEKTVDLKVAATSGGIFYCEIKSPKLISDPVMGGYKHTTTASQIHAALHKAVKQFKNQNASHLVPNVLVWTSENFQLDYTKFIDAFQGYVKFEETVIRDFRPVGSFKRSRNDYREVDLHLWLQLARERDGYRVLKETFFPLYGAHPNSVAILRALRAHPIDPARVVVTRT